ncbi:MAG: hypothetical protein ABJD68_10270 [Nakamurella sp.]
MARQPYIVTLAGKLDEFRSALAAALPQASVGRELSGGRVVVVIPAGECGALASLPDVISVTPDELRHTLRPGRSGSSGPDRDASA